MQPKYCDTMSLNFLLPLPVRTIEHHTVLHVSSWGDPIFL
jgi:hypothetical protein